jgi:hypothetical protein
MASLNHIPGYVNLLHLCHIELVSTAAGWACLHKGYGTIISFLGQLPARLQIFVIIQLKYSAQCGAFLIAA